MAVNYPLHYLVITNLKQELSLEHYCLSPHIMQWNEDTWIINLGPTLSYWQSKSDDLGELFDKILKHHFGDEIIAVQASHPWQGLVLAYALQAQKRYGYFSFSNLFNQKLFRDVEWSHFWQPSDDLCQHLERLGCSGFQASHFRSKRGQMKRFIQRMMLPGPFALQEAEAQSIQRRFSALIGDLWRWTFYGVRIQAPNKSNVASSASNVILSEAKDLPLASLDLFSWANCDSDLLGFPWEVTALPEPPRQLRYLEHPITLWDHIEPLLKEDFERLVKHGGFANEAKVSQITWQVTLYNLQSLDLQLNFRNPYDLRADAPAFSTALYQAYYAFIDAMKALSDRDSDLDLPEQIPFIGWQLIISQQIFEPPVIQDFFKTKGQQSDDEQILALENRLPANLKRYRIAPNPIPELAFFPVQVKDYQEFAFSTDEWAKAAHCRPMYYLPQPKKLSDPKTVAGFQFLERVTNDWWRQDCQHFQRDYYLVRNEQNQILWVFKDKEEWYQHGLFS